MTPEAIQAMIERDERFVAAEPDYRAHFDWAERLSPAEREVYRRLLEHSLLGGESHAESEDSAFQLSPELRSLLQTTAQVWRA